MTRNLIVSLAAALALTACEPIAETSNTAADSSKRVVHDTMDKWRELFTYKSKGRTAQLPQTRYCYKTQSDTVCYDSPQISTTSKLVGYQDGPNISWVQPGGGSLGVSGGEPTTVFPVNAVPVPAAATNLPMDNSVQVQTTTPVAGYECPTKEGEADPFYCRESPYVSMPN